MKGGTELFRRSIKTPYQRWYEEKVGLMRVVGSDCPVLHKTGDEVLVGRVDDVAGDTAVIKFP